MVTNTKRLDTFIYVCRVCCAHTGPIATIKKANATTTLIRIVLAMHLPCTIKIRQRAAPIETPAMGGNTYSGYALFGFVGSG
jgi:hypothetical protein